MRRSSRARSTPFRGKCAGRSGAALPRASRPAGTHGYRLRRVTSSWHALAVATCCVATLLQRGDAPSHIVNLVKMRSGESDSMRQTCNPAQSIGASPRVCCMLGCRMLQQRRMAHHVCREQMPFVARLQERLHCRDLECAYFCAERRPPLVRVHEPCTEPSHYECTSRVRRLPSHPVQLRVRPRAVRMRKRACKKRKGGQDRGWDGRGG